MDETGRVEACIRADYERLVRVVSVGSDSVEAAEDAVQEAFGRAWERARRGQHIDRIGAWIATVALNLTRSRWRRLLVERRHRSSPQTIADPADVGALVDLDRAVRELPLRQRQAVALHYLLDLDVASVATVLGVSDGTVKTALARARTKLAVALSEYEEDRCR